MLEALRDTEHDRNRGEHVIIRNAALIGLATGLLATAAQADDMACKKMLVDVLTKTLQTPSHTYLSVVDSSPGGTTTNSETIYAGNKIYVKDSTGWGASPLSQQKAAETTVSMIRDAQSLFVVILYETNMWLQIKEYCDEYKSRLVNRAFA